MNEDVVQYSAVLEMVPSTPLLSPKASTKPASTSWADADADDDTWEAPSTWWGTVVEEKAPASPTFLPPAPAFADEPEVPDIPVLSGFVVYSERQTPPEPAFLAASTTDQVVHPQPLAEMEKDVDMGTEPPAITDEADDDAVEALRSDARLSKFARPVPVAFQ